MRAWQESGDLRKAMAVLRSLKRLRVLNLRSNPACEQRGYRAWVLANAPRLEMLDESAVLDAESSVEVGSDEEGAIASCTAAHADGRASDGVPSTQTVGRRLFGVPLAELLIREQSSIPAIVQECTRHVQQRRPTNRTALTADGDPSLVLTLRKAFETGAAQGEIALRQCVHTDYRDVQAACSCLRAFLLELPQVHAHPSCLPALRPFQQH